MKTETAPPIRLADYHPPHWTIRRIALDVALHPARTRVRATLAVERHPQGDRDAPLVLDGDALTLVSAALDGAPLAAADFRATADRFTLHRPPSDAFTLELMTEINPSANSQLMGLYRSSGVYCTQCEAEGFRRITYFIDRPDVMARYTTRIEADKAEAPVLLSNGNLIEAGELPGGRHFAVWDDPYPKPSYLFALVGGKLGHIEDHFRTQSGRDVTLRIYVEPGKEDRCGYAMDSLKRAMRWDEEVFGREYDLDIFMIVAVSDFNMGAMENKGLNVFNDKYVLASPETATDADYAGIESVIAHEYFHNWTGNRITCRDWFQLCLKEGLTVYRDQEFSADQRSRAVRRIGDVRTLRAAQFIEDAGPLAHPVRPDSYREINNFYTATVYEKGAELVRMIHALIGAQAFRAGMDLYFQRHDGEAATVEQFVRCFADVSALDFDHFMRWYSQAGTPRVTVTDRYDAAARRYTLEFVQQTQATPGQAEKKPQLIPLAVALFGPDGAPLYATPATGALQDGVFALGAERAALTFENVAARPVASINRGFTAPITLVTSLSADDLATLAAYDTDPFNRWQAIQTLALRRLVANVARIRDGQAPERDGSLLAALARLIARADQDPAFAAAALTMPEDAEIGREIGDNLDPDAIHAAKMALRAEIGLAFADELRGLRERFRAPNVYSADAESAGRRSLRNVALELLVAAGRDGAIADAFAQYRNATNMTDRAAALATLSRRAVPERAEALQDFYGRYADEPLIVDKWLSLQAAIPEAETLPRVRAMLDHPAFSFGNPNRVRALIGSFAQSNPTQFNRADGAGYAFVADQVLALDARNPQVAARLLSAFRSWRSMEPERRAKAEAELRRIAARGGLSRDVADILERTLA